MDDPTGFRVFASDGSGEAAISEVVNQAQHLCKGVLYKVDGVDVEEALGGEFMTVLDERWQEYDEAFISNRSGDTIPTGMICAKVVERCGVHHPLKFTWLCHDFLRQLEQIKEVAGRRS